MLNCVIVDDEPLAREILAGYISDSGVCRLAASFRSAEEAKVYFFGAIPDLLFLDINMPDMTGIELLRSLNNPPLTVFTTAYRDYALEGFELGVIDFLLKPFSYDRFMLAVSRVREFISLRNENQLLDEQPSGEEFIYVKSGTERVKILLDSITHIQGLKDYAIIHTAGKKVVVKGSVKSMQSLFDERRFMRVHKSFIVAKSKILQVNANRIMIGDQAVPLGRSYRTAVDAFVRR